MLTCGPAKKVTVHLNSDTSSGENFIYEEVFSFLMKEGVAGATLIRPQESFGVHRQLHNEGGHGSGKRHLPVRIEFIEAPDTVDQLLPRLCELVTDGLIDVQDTAVVKIARQESHF